MTHPQESMVLRTVYLPRSLDADLKQRAFVLGVTKGGLMRDLVREALQMRVRRSDTFALGDADASNIIRPTQKLKESAGAHLDREQSVAE